MKNWAKKILSIIMVLGAMLLPVMPVAMAAQPVLAMGDDGCGENQVNTSLFGCVDVETDTSTPGNALNTGKNGLKRILSLIVSVLLYGLGVIAVIGVVVAGIMYLTARDNEAQVAKAKKRLLEVVIGLVAWAALFSILNWLIPGFEASDLPYSE